MFNKFQSNSNTIRFGLDTNWSKSIPSLRLPVVVTVVGCIVVVVVVVVEVVVIVVVIGVGDGAGGPSVCFPVG